LAESGRSWLRVAEVGREWQKLAVSGGSWPRVAKVENEVGREWLRPRPRVAMPRTRFAESG
jgi:hypothetical protein